MHRSSCGEYVVVRDISKKIELNYIIHEKIVHFVGSYCICILKCTVRKIVKYSSTLSLTSSRDKLDCQRHAPAALPREKPDTHSIGGWVGPRVGLDG
jgi:hypothetical protein